MRFAASAHSGNDFKSVVDAILGQVIPAMDSYRPTLGFLFCSTDFEEHLADAVQRILEETFVEHLIGCTAEGVIGPEREYERIPSMSLWLAHLPGSAIDSFHLTNEDIQTIESDIQWRNALQSSNDINHLLILGDPFSIDVQMMLNKTNEFLPGCAVSGGMCSGGYGPGTSKLVYNGNILNEGAVGVALNGTVHVETIVSQGCRPIGQPMLITDGEKNLIKNLAGRTPIEVVNELLPQISDRDRELLQNGLFVGRVIDEYKAENTRGDFLIRNIMGVDQENGYIAVMDRVRPGITIQFHVRDSVTADEDLRYLLAPYCDDRNAGALLFSCNGRGTRMYDDPDHDLHAIQNGLHSPPIAGFFCAGEFGPVGGNNFIHGHTASIVLFRNA